MHWSPSWPIGHRTGSNERWQRHCDSTRRSTAACPCSIEILVEVDAYLELFVNPEPDVRALLVMWGSTFPSNALVDGMGEAERRSYEGLSGQIASGQKEGSVRLDVDPMTNAVLLHGLMRGVAALFLSDADPAEMDDVRRTCHEWVASALAPR